MLPKARSNQESKLRATRSYAKPSRARVHQRQIKSTPEKRRKLTVLLNRPIYRLSLLIFSDPSYRSEHFAPPKRYKPITHRHIASSPATSGYPDTMHKMRRALQSDKICELLNHGLEASNPPLVGDLNRASFRRAASRRLSHHAIAEHRRHRGIKPHQINTMLPSNTPIAVRSRAFRPRRGLHRSRVRVPHATTTLEVRNSEPLDDDRGVGRACKVRQTPDTRSFISFKNDQPGMSYDVERQDTARRQDATPVDSTTPDALQNAGRVAAERRQIRQRHA